MAPATDPVDEAARTAVILVGHGSERYPEAGQQLIDQAARIARRGAFAEVRAGTIYGAPGLDVARAPLTADRVLILPMMMCDGEVARDRVRAAFDLNTSCSERSYHLLTSIGLCVGMSDIIEQRVIERLGRHARGAPVGTVLLVGHGSSRDAASRQATEQHAERLRRRGRLAGVHTAYLSESPRLENVLPHIETPAIAVGLFSAVGGHASEDVPQAIEAAGLTSTMPYLGAIGADAAIADLAFDILWEWMASREQTPVAAA